MDLLLPEEWREVPGFDGRYEVSNYGHVRSVTKVIPHRRHSGHSQTMPGVVMRGHAGRHLKTSINTGKKINPYHTVKLCWNGENRTLPVHRLVAEVFIPNPEGYPLVRHLDKDHTNNVMTNLKWGTHKQNTHDRTCKNCGHPIHEA